MGKIKKVASERHTATASPFILDFVKQATSVPLHKLPPKLLDFPKQWPFPRGDLYHWIPLLDRFDHFLEAFNKEYGLDKGPQQQPFACRLLQKGDAHQGAPHSSSVAQVNELQNLGYSAEGDKEVVESMLQFTRILLERCGNRSLYASSGHLNDLLHTTSLSLLGICLRLTLRLAQRFQATRTSKSHSSHAMAALLANHFNISFDRLYKTAQPFPKPPHTLAPAAATSGKNKEKVASIPSYNPCDLVALVKQPKATAENADLAGVHLTYCDVSSSAQPSTAQQGGHARHNSANPVRRTSALGPSRDRPPMGERSATAGDVGLTAPAKSKEDTSSLPKYFTISPAKVRMTPAWDLVREAVETVPSGSAYDVLHRVRVAKALADAEQYAHQIVEIRLLSIANLAYAVGELKFQENVGVPDSEEPKRFHLAQQLCDLLQPAANGKSSLSLATEIVVLLAIEGLARSRHKSAEVADALQISHNHGVLYYELRKVIATLNMEEHVDARAELLETEWRDALFDLTNALQSNSQAKPGERMVSAGIMGILVEALKFRTSRAERFHEKIIGFLDSFIYGIPTAFETLANVKGLDLLADLVSYEVSKSLRSGQALPEAYKSQVVDYTIPYFQQASLRQLLKFIVHMFEHNVGTHDRLLRNLIDSPPVLSALKSIIDNSAIFGSIIWTGAVNIMSNFIHNEPTSFQVVSEAGLVKAFLQTIVPSELGEDAVDQAVVEFEYKDGELQFPTASGILPVAETMWDIPTAFGAICLNESGMKMFQSSNALLKFMDIFVSPLHARVIDETPKAAMNIGRAFDELSRHHPPLKDQITAAVVSMIKRVVKVCQYMAERRTVGAKLYERTPNGLSVSGGKEALRGPCLTDPSALDGRSEAPTTLLVGDLPKNFKDIDTCYRLVSVCCKFLEVFFENSGMCSLFCERGGAIFLLDLATSACLPHDIVTSTTFEKISVVIKTLSDAKPHLVLPSLLRRTQIAVANVKPLVDNTHSNGAFASFLDLSKPHESTASSNWDGTTVVKSLASTQVLTTLLGRVLLHTPPSRHSPSSKQICSLMNFTDVYVELVNSLSRLHAACIWEESSLTKRLPEKWESETDPKPFTMKHPDPNGMVEITANLRNNPDALASVADGASEFASGDDVEEQLTIKNAKTIRHLLDRTPKGIQTFLHSLSQALLPPGGPSRRPPSDQRTKQHAAVVADTIARALIWELNFRKYNGPEDAMAMAKIQLSSLTFCTHTLLKTAHAGESWPTKEALTLVLNKFYLAKGFDSLNACLERFSNVLLEQQKSEPKSGSSELGSTSHEVLNVILSFYEDVVRQKSINGASQSVAMQAGGVPKGESFVPDQFLVELRDAVLPAVNKLWQSELIESFGAIHTKTIIEIMRAILKADGEDRAIKRSDQATRRIQANPREYSLNEAALPPLTSSGHEDSLQREALYRCNHNETSAMDYRNLRETQESAPSFPIPTNNSLGGTSTAATEPPPQDAVAAARPDGAPLQTQISIDMPDAGPERPAHEQPTLEAHERSSTGSLEDPDAMSDGDAFRPGHLPMDVQNQDLIDRIGPLNRLHDILHLTGGAANSSVTVPVKDTHEPFRTVDDLDENRLAVKQELIDRCLELLSAQPSMSFELADLIQAAVAKSVNDTDPRADIGQTLVSSLLSLQGEEEESGAKIAAYSHLFALILQDTDFFKSALEELKENFGALVTWTKLGHNQNAADAPWIEMVLLIIERVLGEDESPPETAWNPPPADDPLKVLDQPPLPDPIVEPEARSALLDSLIDLLTKIGENGSLALSVTRVLAILTKRRDLAVRLSEKRNLSRLFVMIRQLAGPIDYKVQSSVLIILRHLVEDEQTIRQIMQTEIRTVLESSRNGRSMDTSTYTRNLSHLVLRDSRLFVEVSREMVEIRYDGNPHRAHAIALRKKDAVPSDSADEGQKTTATLEKAPTGLPAEEKPSDGKGSTAEAADSVVSALLRELLNFRDVEDVPVAPANGTSSANSGTDDVVMTDPSSWASARMPNDTSTTAADSTRNDKPAFKPEEHGSYIFRCFILQCLSELLGSYNRTKLEFINFSRKAETNVSTPTKPRSSTLNYLLNSLIPIGTLEHRDDIAHRKKLPMSHWATNVIVTLCTRTPELHVPRGAEEQDDTDLMYVRKFVLEHALRSFKDATSSAEPPDLRYSRLLSLSELFSRMLSNKADAGAASSRRIGKLMYEKSFVSAITSAIAEVDLNFPNAKRAVKYILAPLKLLTELGVSLSQSPDWSSSAIGASDEGEISSATSVSEDQQEDRELTPDLYRNSTLGMFEARGNRNHSESESEDDEGDDDMYDDRYDDEMDFEEDPIAEHGDVVSDEDQDEMDGMGGGNVEGLPGDEVDMDIEVVMDGPPDDDDDSNSDTSGDDEENDEDSEDDDDGEDLHDPMEEITGDDENASLADHDEEWEEDEGGDYDGQDLGAGPPHGGPLDQIARVIGAADDQSDDPEDRNAIMDLAGGNEEYFEDEMAPEDDEGESAVAPCQKSSQSLTCS